MKSFYENPNAGTVQQKEEIATSIRHKDKELTEVYALSQLAPGTRTF